jgi:membrane dipeptidase
MLFALAENGGVIQICFVSSFVKTPDPNPERDAAMARLEEKYGSRSDISDGETRKKWREEYMAIRERYPSKRATIKDIVDHIDHVVDLIGVDHVGIGTDFDGGGGVDGCDDVSEMPNITEELIRRGYSEEDIRKIWGGNLMRVFRAVEDAAKQ